MIIKTIKSILLITLISLHWCSAQEDIFFRVSLAKEKIDIPYFPFKFSEVIDNRFNKEMIGCVQRGMSNKRGLANFATPLREEFIGLLTQSNLIDRKDSLVLIVNNIWINELTTKWEEKGIVQLDILIAKKTDNNLVILANPQISIVENQLDATTNHDTRIALAIQKGLYNFQITPKSRYKMENFIPLTTQPDSVIYKTKFLPKGLFNTAHDLLTNTIDKKQPFFKEVDYLQNKAFVRDTFSEASIRKFFAFSNGEHIFINSLLFSYSPSNKRKGFLFHRIELSGALVMIEDVTNTQTNLGASIGLGLGGGILGGAIGGALLGGAGGLINLNSDIDLILDLRNGSMLEFNEPNLKYLLMEFPEMREKFEKMDREVRENYNTQIQFVKRMNELIAKK